MTDGLACHWDQVTVWDVFERRPVWAASSRGSRYLRWVPDGMPKLGKYQRLLKSVFFLYRTRKDAEAGVRSGATGFIALVPLQSDPTHFLWVGVTNWHAAVQKGFSVARINRKDGGTDIFEYEPHEWHFVPGGPDVAAIPMLLNRHVHDTRGMGLSMFLTQARNREEHLQIDVGDDVFMPGRFIDYDGIETNKPSLRFGNISIMDAPVRQPTGHCGPSFVLDMHSRTGFSGSPVFVYRTSGSYFGEIPDDDVSKAEMWIGHTLLLLGLHWGQFPEKWKLGDEAGSEGEEEANNKNPSLITDGKYVSGMSGMTCAIPAEDILEVLAMPSMKKALADIEARLPKEAKEPPIAEAADDEADHRERFNRLKALAVKSPKSSG